MPKIPTPGVSGARLVVEEFVGLSKGQGERGRATARVRRPGGDRGDQLRRLAAHRLQTLPREGHQRPGTRKL